MRSDLENFRATTNHRRPGRILYYTHFVEDLHRRVVEHIGTEDFESHYNMAQVQLVDMSPPKDLKPLDFSKYWENETLPEGTKFNDDGVAMVPSGFYHFWGYISPLRNATSLRELEEYPIRDYSTWDASTVKKQVEKIHREGKIAKIWIGQMYETAWQIRGYEEFLMDMVERPSWAECLLDRLFQQNIIRAKALAASGAEWVMTGDDVANQKTLMFAPHQWRDLIFSRWKKVWRTIKDINPNAKIWYHTDGNATDILDDMLDAGLDILNPVQPECLDVDAVYRRYGSRLTFDGCLGTQSTMPWGTVADVRNRVKEMIDKYGRNGGLIISPTHILEPEVPIANIEAFVQACRDFGTFE